MAIKKAEKPYVLVCTEYRAVFAGYLEVDKSPDYVVLSDARNCIRWVQPGKGILALASDGPSRECMIGAKTKELRAFRVTAVAPISDEARAKWEARS